MEQISNYFEHMDYISFSVIALPCVVIAVYGFLQVASGLAKGKNDNMQRRNSNNQNNNKRFPQKYNMGCNGNLAGAGAAATAADIMTTNNATNGAYKNPSSRKSRYNKRQQQDQQQKRSPVCDFVTSSSVASSSCIEEKFLVTHNPGHRNSTSSEVTTSSEDLDSSREHLNRSKADGGTANQSCNNNNNKKSRAKRQSKPPAKPGKHQPQQQQQTQQEAKVNKSKPTGATGAGSGNGSKWRQVNNQQQQQQQQQQHKQRSHQQKKKNGNNLANKSHHQMNSSSSSGNSSCSSSALSSPTNSPGKPGKQQQLQHLHYHHQLQLQHPQQQQSLFDWSEFAAGNVNFHVPPMRQFEQMEMDMNDAHALVMQQLRRHIIGHHLLRVYGFPVESVVHEGAIEIFKCLPPHVGINHHVELAGTKQLPVTVINYHDGLTTTLTTTAVSTSPGMCMDNGASSLSAASSFSTSLSSDSGNSSPRNLDSENSSAGEWSGSECTGDLELDFCTSDRTSSSSSFSGSEEVEEDVPEEDQQQASAPSLAKQCTRCARLFLVDEQTGEYITHEECCYHEGKYQHYAGRWSCCQMATELASGCCQNDYHVWAGSVIGVNGPYHDFVRTTHRSPNGSAASYSLDNPSVYALDCEMSYTARGLDVTKVSLVALNGQLIYEQFVQPDCPIVDFNTRYSGITEQDLLEAKSLAQVQRDLLEIISADTILIGHGLDNDLRALRIVHNTLIDTSITFPHASGFPYRRALRHLTKMHLKREIQSGDGTTGHSSFEDSLACMELMLWRVRRELLDPNWSWED